MLITCPECNGKVSDKAPGCPHCGYPMSLIRTEETETIKRVAKKVAKKKRQKLPNGFGSIKRITGKRERYGVYPPTTKAEFDDNGNPPSKKALCYVDDWHTGFYALMEYKNGTFDPEKFKTISLTTNAKNDDVINKIIESYNNQNRVASTLLTFADVYKLFMDEKFNSSRRQFSESTRKNLITPYNHCRPLYDRPFSLLVASDLQKIIDDCPLKHSSLELITNLFRQMYAYAIKNNITDKDYAKYVTINIDDDDEKGEPFTEEEIKILWNDKEDPVTQIILIMIYSGFRIAAFESIEINMDEKYFKGGVKTKAGKSRIVPIHSCIQDYVTADTFYNFDNTKFRKVFYKKLEELKISEINGKKHTPHDTRHTFSWLCDKYKVDEVSKHMLMGHSLGKDVEKNVYSHRTLEELKASINMIKTFASV